LDATLHKRAYPFLQGGGEMGALVRNYNWSQSSIGSPDQWPQALRISLSNVLSSGFPMFLFWGDELTCFYNDAYRPSLGVEGKHPAIGKGGKELWPEIWDFIGPLIESVMRTGESVWFENQYLPIYRNGTLEDVYWTFSYSLIRNDDDSPGGVLVTCMETTAAVLDRKKLEESQDQLQFALKAAHLGSWRLVLKSLVLEASSICKLNFGQPQDLPFSYETLQSVIHPEDQERQKEAVLHTVTTGADYDIEYRVIWPDNSIHWVNVRGQLQYGENNAPESMVGVSLDITARKEVEKKLLESEAKLRSILNSAPTAIGVFVGPDLIVENPNQLMIEVLAAGSHIEGKSFRDLLSGLVGEDQKFLQLIDTVRTTGQPFGAQEVEVFFKAEKRTRYFNINFIPLFDVSGVVYAVLDVSVDVTGQVLARKKVEESEKALANALEQVRLSKEAAELGTFDMELKKGTMHWDERCRTLFGISHQGAVTYEKDFVEGLHADDRDRILALIKMAFNKAESNGDYDVEYRTIGAEDGIERWVRAKGKVYFDETGTPIRFIGSVLDITEQKTALQKIEKTVEERTKELAQANERLQVINRELHRSNLQLEEFAHAASHDLKEPIRKIHFFTQQLRDQLGDRLKEGEVRSFGRIENASQRMGHLVDDLLLYSHVSQRPHETEAVDLNEIAQRVLEDLELDIEEKGASVSVENLPVVQGYRRQLQQLLQNFISNAVKYSRNDVLPRISITGSIVAKDDLDYNLIEVKDNGIGFEPEYTDKIFQMFTRLHGKNEYSGTGVGLSIVKKVVENHNGFIQVESSPGQGSNFMVFLPTE
jgi:PAS domain S-box-containing protein